MHSPVFLGEFEHLAGHYDTLFKKAFIGANDGASSTAILLAFADALEIHGGRTLKHQI